MSIHITPKIDNNLAVNLHIGTGEGIHSLMTEYQGEPIFAKGFVDIVMSKALAHKLWKIIKEYRASLPRYRKEGKTCPTCGTEIDDRATGCPEHGHKG